MSDAEFRRKAFAVLVQAAKAGNLGHCVGCDKHAAAGIAHAPRCPVAELLAAGRGGAA